MKATAAAVMTPVAVQPSAVSQGPLTSLPMMRGLPPTSITRRSNGGARSPLTTSERTAGARGAGPGDGLAHDAGVAAPQPPQEEQRRREEPVDHGRDEEDADRV